MVSSSAPRTGRPWRPQSGAERPGESGGRCRRLAPPSAAYALLPVAGLHPLPSPHPRNPHLRREAQPPLARSGSAPLPPCVGHHRLHGDLAVCGGHRRPRRSSPCHRAPYPLPPPSSSPPPPRQLPQASSSKPRRPLPHRPHGVCKNGASRAGTRGRAWPRPPSAMGSSSSTSRMASSPPRGRSFLVRPW
jgi:hypothetical protein